MVNLVNQYNADITHKDENFKFQNPVPSTPQSPSQGIIYLTSTSQLNPYQSYEY